MKNKNRKSEAQSMSFGHLAFAAWVATGLLACGGGGPNNVEQFPTQPVAINVPSAEVMPTYTLDSGGGATTFPVSEYDDGNFVLIGSTSSSDVAVLGSSHIAMPAPVREVQDSVGYSVQFQHETGDAVPQNVDTPVQAGEVVDIDRALPIAVTSATVTPSFQHNGVSNFPVSEYDDGVFYLQPSTGGERIFLGNSHSVLPDAVQVMQGTYDVIYSLETGGDLVPANQSAVVMSDVPINADGPLNVNVQSVRFQFNATLDGAPFSGNQYQTAVFFLRNTLTGDRVELGAFFELPATLFVVEGTYDIVYQHVQGDGLPINTDAIVAKDVLINSANASQLIDIRSVAITPSFSLNGGAFPQSEYNDANFYLRSMNNPSDVMFLGASETVPAVVRVIRSDLDTDLGAGVLALGAYEVLYRHESGAAVPQNTNAIVLSSQSLTMDGGLAVPVTSIEVAGVFTLNGNNFPNDAGDSVEFFLSDASNASDQFHFGFSDISNEAVKLIPGTYHVMMDHLAGDAVPQNEMHAIDFNNVLDVNTSLRVNVPAVRVDPSFTLDGAAFPASIYQSATFYLRDIHTGTRIFLGQSYKKNNPVMVIKEDHQVIYEHLHGEQVPQNTNSKIVTIDL